MTVYIVNIILILFWGLVLLREPQNSLKVNEDKRVKQYCGIVALQWILISGLRHKTVGADTIAYGVSFEDVKGISWNKIFSNIFDYLFKGADIKDPGYKLVQKAFQIFCDDYQIYLIFIALIFTGFMAVWIYRNSSMPVVSFIIYSTLFYSFYSVTGHRQTIATALVVFWGYKYIKERKLIKFLLLSFVAFLIHKSSIVFVPFYFIANIPVTTPYIIVALVVTAAVSLSGKSIYGFVAENLGYGEEQINYTGGGAETYALVLTLLCVVTLLLYSIYKNHTDKATHIFNITLLTLMSSLLIFQNQGFMRIQQYYSLFIMISFPEVIKCFNKRDQTIVSVVSIGLLIFYLFMNAPQYKFFWQ